MINEKRANILRYLIENQPVNGMVMWEKFGTTAGLADGGYIECIEGTQWRITDTGRLRLEEYQGAQEAKSLTQDELWQRIHDVEEAMNDEQSHYGKTPAWRSMKAEHTALWKLATDSGEGAQEVSADASPVVSDAATIAALEAENAALRGMLAKALDAIAPVAETSLDNATASADNGAWLYVSDQWNGWNQGGYVRIDTVAGSLTMGDLRNIATIAADIRAALDPITPYENTPDGSDLLARDTEADDDE